MLPAEQIVSRPHVQAGEDRIHHSDDTFAALVHLCILHVRLVFAGGNCANIRRMPLRIFETGSLLGVALDAARSINAPARHGGQKPALISIIFSVVALEAFINELTELALDSRNYPQGLEHPAVTTFGEFMTEAESSHASLESKFLLGNWILTGQQSDKGTTTYQDFILLVSLRNTLLHFKANPAFEQGTRPEEVHQKLFNKFRSKNILAEDAQMSDGTWTFLVETKAVAEWSCRTAAQMVTVFCSRVPQCGLKPMLSLFEKSFEPENLARTLKARSEHPDHPKY